MTSVIDDGLDLVFLFAFDQVRQWPCEVGTVSRGLLVSLYGKSSEEWNTSWIPHDKGSVSLYATGDITLLMWKGP